MTRVSCDSDRQTGYAWLMKKLLEIGNRVSSVVANAAGHPLGQIIVVVFCASWFIIGGSAAENALTLVLSVVAITLTQMVLNQQKRSEKALHLKIDELIFSVRGARNEMAAIEGLTEEELEALRRTGDAAEDVLESRKQS